MTGVIIEYGQEIKYEHILGILGKLGIAQSMNKMHSPLSNYHTETT